MAIRIYDGSNYYRVSIETDSSGLTPRNLFLEMSKPDVQAIWVWDGPGNNSYRREIYPGYKMNRKPTGEDIYAGINHFKKVLRHTGAIQIEVPGYEGDDVVATLAQKYASPDCPVSIYTNDFDYYQLHSNPHIISGVKPKEGVEPHEVRLYKALVGDPSDNIKGIPGFGPKAWEECRRHRIQNWLLRDMPLEEFYSADEVVVAFGVSKKIANWLFDGGDLLIRDYWEIVAFRDVPTDLIQAHLTVGDRDYAAGDKLLREFHL